MKFRIALLIYSCVFLSGSVCSFAEDALQTKSQSAQKKISFVKDIRPILSETCFACHGPDEKSREGDLRLDTKAGAFAKRDAHQTIVVGHPEQSELIRRLLSKDKEERMPPPDAEIQLTPEKIALLKRWVQEGAEWEDHWAFVPPKRSPLPKVKNKKWAHNSVDLFVLKHLEQAQLAPAKEASKETWLRRLSLDLIGLPPTIEEIDTFLADKQPDAYERQIDRLLNSPHYGERWGRIWLDAARYADSDGFEKDMPRTVWFYRDWVINSLNADMPYNQFIIEQIAGDLLPDATQSQIVATGFLRNSMINEEGGIDPEEFRMVAMFDRMDAIGKSVLGLTIQCAQCHSHKYDPFSQEEYYRMFACINDSDEGSITAYTSDQQMQREGLFQRIQHREQALQQADSHWKQKLTKWEAAVANNQPQWQVLAVKSDANSQRHYYLPDGSLLAQGYAPSRYTHKYSVSLKEKRNIDSFQLELLTDPNLPALGPGRGQKGLAALTEFQVTVVDQKDAKKNRTLKFVKVTADYNQPRRQLSATYQDKNGKIGFTGPAEYAIDGKNDTAWGIDAGPGRRNRARKIVFRLEKPVELPAGTKLTVGLSQMHGGWNSNERVSLNLGRFRLSTTAAPDVVADPIPRNVRNILDIPAIERTRQQQAAVFSYWRTTVSSWKNVNAEIEKLWKLHPEGTTQLVYHHQEQPRKTYFLNRGDFLKRDHAVQPGVAAFLNAPPGEGPIDRLTFARWLVDRKSPTTARAIVNRVWQSYFGKGFISTSDDLGLQGELPTHPELLDWLAVELMEQGWSLKQLHRLITTSATYRQSSRVSEKLLKRDPENLLYARGPRFRVDAEIVRDIALFASGLLNPELGGSSLYQAAPRFLYLPPASYGNKKWNTEQGPNRYRRSLYTFQYRSVPYPVMQSFDAPNGDISCVRRSRSNTPLQALTLMNEPIFFECAEALARQTLRREQKDDHKRLEFAFRSCLSRKPTKQESKLLLAFLKKQTDRFSTGELDPRKIFTAGDTNTRLFNLTNVNDLSIPPEQLAAWTALSRVLLNLDETITKE